ncbi:MAG: zinc transporter ZupT [Clostridium sp.]|nr:zinc transporter ZupT [Clostridium sp.]
MLVEHHHIIAFALTLIAGLATIIGGSVSFFVKRSNLRMLAIGLGFSAGVMIYMALTEILKDSKEFTTMFFGNKAALITFLGFFAGIIIAALIDYFLPAHFGDEMIDKAPQDISEEDEKIKKAGLLTAIAISLHRFPEGLTMFLVASTNLKLGIPLVIAMAIHNLPEGIAIGLPMYHATGKRRYAMLFSAIAGISGPIGALIGFFIIQLFMPQMAVGILFAMVAGIMVYISLDTLLPTAREYGENHDVMAGIFAGMFFIGAGLLLV